MEEDLKPTYFALENAVSILTRCLPANDTKTTVFCSPTNSEGLRVEWTNDERIVSLVLAANPEEKSYIYYSTIGSHGVEGVTTESLLNRLQWLSESREE